MRLYPLGYPVDIETNSRAVLAAAFEAWRDSAPIFHGAAMRFEVRVHPGPAPSIPPKFTASSRRFHLWCDDRNFAEFSFTARLGRMEISEGFVSQSARFQHSMLGPLVLTALDSAYFAPVHAACVARDGEGLLLCGDSGAGKSTLAYACVRSGWTLVSDDAMHMAPGPDRIGVGGSSVIRLREPARALYPELTRFQTGTAPNGKRAIEIDAAACGFSTARHAAAAQFFFLRRRPGPAEVRPIEMEEALRILGNPIESRDLTAIRPRWRELLLPEPVALEYETIDDAVATLAALPVGRLQEARA